MEEIDGSRSPSSATLLFGALMRSVLEHPSCNQVWHYTDHEGKPHK